MRFIKRLLTALFVIIVVLFTCILPAYADSASGVTEYVSWEMLATSGGAVLLTLLIVEFLKLPLDRVWKIPTRFVVFIIALILLILYETVTVGVLTFPRIPLIVLNAIVVTLATMGSYEVTFKKVEAKYMNKNAPG